MNGVEWRLENVLRRKQPWQFGQSEVESGAVAIVRTFITGYDDVDDCCRASKIFRDEIISERSCRCNSYQLMNLMSTGQS